MKAFVCFFGMLFIFPSLVSAGANKRELGELNSEIEKVKSYIQEGDDSKELKDVLKQLQDKKKLLISKSSNRKVVSKKRKSKKSKPIKAKSDRKNYTIQISAYEEEEMAFSKLKELQSKGVKAYYVSSFVNGQAWYRVGVGQFTSIDDAKAARLQLLESGKVDQAFLRNITTDLFKQAIWSNETTQMKKAPKKIQKLSLQSGKIKQVQSKDNASNERVAQEKSKSPFSSNLTAVSDYIWRGQTQTSGEMAVQAGLVYTYHGIGIGVWGSNVSGGSELDLYSSFSHSFENYFEMGIGFTFYHYNRSPSSDTFEYNFFVNFGEVSTSVNYTDKYFGSDSASWYYNGSYELALREESLFISFAAGFTQFENKTNVGNLNYSDQKISLLRRQDNYELGIHWTDTNRQTYDGTTSTEVNDRAVSVSLGKEF